MPKDHLCEYGNCEQTNVDVSVTYHGNRVTFCSVDHAALWLLRRQYPRAGVTLDTERVKLVSATALERQS